MLKIVSVLVITVMFAWISTCAQQKHAIPKADTSYNVRLNAAIAHAKKVQNNKDSLPYFIKQFKSFYAESHDKTALVYANYYDAYYTYLSANHLKAMAQTLTCLANAQRWKVDQLLPPIYQLIGNMHKEASNYPMAFDAANKGLQIARQNKDTANIISLLGLKAMFIHTRNLQLNKPTVNDGSLELQFEGLRLAESSPKWERIRIRFYDNIAQSYKDIANYPKAIYYATKGVNLATKLNEKRSLTYGYTWLGQALYFSGKREEGMAAMKKALAISIEIKQPFRTMELYESIGGCYEWAGDYKNALEYINIHRALKDSLQVQANTKQIGELQLKYETVKKDKDIALLSQADHTRQRQMIFTLIGGTLFVLVTVVLLVMYNIIRNRNRALVASNTYANEQSQKLQVLMQELHHRVKNNLQIVSSLLNLQSSRLIDTDARNVLNVSRQRIDAMSIIHQSLYQHDSANMVNIKEYINNLLYSIMQSFGLKQDDMDLRVDILIKDMDVDVALPLGLILNEWITNVFKHAYRNLQGRPSLELIIFQDGDNVKLEVKDNGLGMPVELWENPKASFGIKLMKVLMKQIRAMCQITNHRGTLLELNIPYC